MTRRREKISLARTEPFSSIAVLPLSRDPVGRDRVKTDRYPGKLKKTIKPEVEKTEKSEKASLSNKKKKPLYRFSSSVQLKAVQSLPIEVDAHFSKEAKELMAVKAKELKLDLTATKLTRKIGPVRKSEIRN